MHSKDQGAGDLNLDAVCLKASSATQIMAENFRTDTSKRHQSRELKESHLIKE